MRKYIGGVPLLVCLFSLAGAAGAHAQQRVYPYPNGESRHEYVEQYAREHSLTKQEKKALDNRLKQEDKNWTRLSWMEQRQLARVRAEQLRVAYNGVYNGGYNSVYNGSYNGVYDRAYGNIDDRDVTSYDNAYGNDLYRYRIGGTTRLTDRAGAELLRRAVDEGYRLGYDSGYTDRVRSHGFDYGRDRTYQDATSGYRGQVDRGDYQYLFQQGYQRGYQDGYYQQLRYGTIVNGRAAVLEAVVNSILGLTVR
jgi:hypothetical protein